MSYLIQQEQRPDLSRPWPILVGDGGTVFEGRPDAKRLIGFQRSPFIQEVNYDFLGKWETAKVKGTFPVFVDRDGQMFTVLDRIEDIIPIEGRHVDA